MTMCGVHEYYCGKDNWHIEQWQADLGKYIHIII